MVTLLSFFYELGSRQESVNYASVQDDDEDEKTYSSKKTFKDTASFNMSRKLIISFYREFEQPSNDRLVVILSPFSLGHFAFTKCCCLSIATDRFRLHSIGKTIEIEIVNHFQKEGISHRKNSSTRG